VQLDGRLHILRLGDGCFRETVPDRDRGKRKYNLTFEKGRICGREASVPAQDPWRFAFRTDADALGEILVQLFPEAGFHDIFGPRVKIGRGRIDGDILCPGPKNLRGFSRK